MIYLKVKDKFDAAHKLDMIFPGGHGCANCHGHTWEVEVTIEEIDFVDFSVLKSDLQRILSVLDHNDLNTIFDVPCAEHITSWIAAQMRERSYRVVEVSLAETSSNYAIFVEKGHPQEEIHKLQVAGVSSSEIESMILDNELFVYGNEPSENRFVRMHTAEWEIRRAWDVFEAYEPGTLEQIGPHKWQKVIHHYDGNKQNDRFQNLRILTVSEHVSMTMQGNKNAVGNVGTVDRNWLISKAETFFDSIDMNFSFGVSVFCNATGYAYSPGLALLSRLTDRGFLTCSYISRLNSYQKVVEKIDFDWRRKISDKAMERLHHGIYPVKILKIWEQADKYLNSIESEFTTADFVSVSGYKSYNSAVAYLYNEVRDGNLTVRKEGKYNYWKTT